MPHGEISVSEPMEAPDAFDMMMMDSSDDQPMFPLNRVVAFFGPYISLLAGVITTWLLTNVHIFTALGASQSDVLEGVTQLIIFVLVSGLTWLGQRKWLTGHIQWEAGQLEIQKEETKAILAPRPAPVVDRGVYDPVAAKRDMEKKAFSQTGASTK